MINFIKYCKLNTKYFIINNIYCYLLTYNCIYNFLDKLVFNCKNKEK